jgi:hypothetical protein
MWGVCMKKSINENLLASQQKAVESSRAMAELAVKNAQEIAALNQKAAQDLAHAFQEKVSELLKVKDPRAAFDLVQAQVLQDAALQVANYQNQVAQVLKTGNRELTRIAEDMIAQSKSDLIHFVNEATANAPAGSDAYVSTFKTAFNHALQNFELIRAATADSFYNFEKSVENMAHLAKDSPAVKKRASKK